MQVSRAPDNVLLKQQNEDLCDISHDNQFLVLSGLSIWEMTDVVG